MQFMDAVEIAGARVTGDGYLVADARIARTGIQIYSGRETGKPELGTVRVYRPEAEVFKDSAMASMAHRPVTNDHPAETVTAANWKTHSVGMTGGDVARDGHFIRVPMTVMDAATIADVQAGKRQLSVGYTCDLAWTPGVTEAGEAYDAIQTNIRGNHLAIVGAGRAGPDCRIHHDQSHQPGGRTVALKTIIVDGLPVETTDAGEAAVNKLRGMLSTADAALTKATTDHKAALDAKDTDLAKKDAEIADLKTKVVTGDALDALVADRASVVSKAKALLPALDVKGKSNGEIKRAALGDVATGKSDAYVDAAFDLKTADLKTPDVLRDAITHGGPTLVGDAKAAADALAARNARYATGYLNQTEKGA